MKHVDRLIQVACKKPGNLESRQAASAAILAEGDEDLADAVEGDSGAELLGRVVEFAKVVQLPITMRLLWAEYRLMPLVRAIPNDEPQRLELAPQPSIPRRRGPGPYEVDCPWREYGDDVRWSVALLGSL